VWGLLLAGSLGAAAWAGEPEQLFAQLQDSGLDYGAEGSGCEQAARLDLAAEYTAPRYEVVTGVGYSQGDRRLGELDAVVFDRSTTQAVLIAEVKCWTDLPGAYRKARQQRERFERIMATDTLANFKQVGGARTRYDQRQFAGNIPFVFIAQAGALEAGFDLALDFTLAETNALRMRIIQCQAKGQCRRPE
jgi:hypothetical protein